MSDQTFILDYSQRNIITVFLAIINKKNYKKRSINLNFQQTIYL